MKQADALIDWYQTLTPGSLDRLPEFYTEDARFSDPFNSVQGHAAIRSIFSHMFATLQDPRFTDVTCYPGNGEVMLRWQFHFVLDQRPVCIEGCSLLTLAADGRVARHQDFWDSAELYRQIPLLKPLFNWLTRKVAAT